MTKIRMKAPVQGVQPVHPIKPPFDPMTPPVKKTKKSSQNRMTAEEYNTIRGMNG